MVAYPFNSIYFSEIPLTLTKHWFIDINGLIPAMSIEMYQWNNDFYLGFLWKTNEIEKQRAWQHETFHTHSLSLGLCVNPQKSHLRSLQMCLYEFISLNKWATSGALIIAGPRHGTKQETGAPYAFKSWSEELRREHTLFIEHKIHITSTRESYFLWHSTIRQPENHAVVCHLGRAPS